MDIRVMSLTGLGDMAGMDTPVALATLHWWLWPRCPPAASSGSGRLRNDLGTRQPRLERVWGLGAVGCPKSCPWEPASPRKYLRGNIYGS